eukprot:7853975-Karenia_brevis.AAC.1
MLDEVTTMAKTTQSEAFILAVTILVDTLKLSRGSGIYAHAVSRVEEKAKIVTGLVDNSKAMCDMLPDFMKSMNDICLVVDKVTLLAKSIADMYEQCTAISEPTDDNVQKLADVGQYLQSVRASLPPTVPQELHDDDHLNHNADDDHR